jgi:hypothetical protein
MDPIATLFWADCARFLRDLETSVLASRSAELNCDSVSVARRGGLVPSEWVPGIRLKLPFFSGRGRTPGRVPSLGLRYFLVSPCQRFLMHFD